MGIIILPFFSLLIHSKINKNNHNEVPRTNPKQGKPQVKNETKTWKKKKREKDEIEDKS